MILTINCGSTSIKYKLFDNNESLYGGEVTGIATDESRVRHTTASEEIVEDYDVTTHEEGIRHIVEFIMGDDRGEPIENSDITAVGHRVVHGGDLTKAHIVNQPVKETIREFASIAPLHNPVNLVGIETMEDYFPNVPQVAVFDTAFHQTMPPEAFLYGIPYEFYENHDVRRYGFHGISHSYVAHKACEMLNRSVNETNLITCHLGGGCSVTAIKQGNSIDTSMGFSPLEGVLMATRSGDIDPTVLEYLRDQCGIDFDESLEILNNESGLAGISGINSRMEDILAAYEAGNERAELAIRKFAYSIRQYVGSYAITLDDVDMIVFTAGIGENVPLVRELIGTLPILGTEIDSAQNEATVGKPGVISTNESNIDVVVIPTKEEYRIAQLARRLTE